MRVFFAVLFLKVASCQYYYDVNQFHEPLTTFDKISKTVKYCIHVNNETLDNTYLTGTWYTIFKFSTGSTGLDSEDCPTHEFTRPSKEDLDKYKAKYDIHNETFSFDNSAVLCSSPKRKTLNGLVVGNKTAKYYFLDPKSSQRLSGMYNVITYKPVNNDYLIYYECSMRGHIKYLWSRRKYQTDEQLEAVVKPLYELKDMGRERFCKTRKVVTTTPYF